MKNYILIIIFALLPLSSFAQKVSFKADIDQMTPMGFPSLLVPVVFYLIKSMIY